MAIFHQPFATRNAKVLPIIASTLSNTNHNESFLDLTDLHGGDHQLEFSTIIQDDYGVGYRRGRDYWHARQAFLNSYHFSEPNGFKEKMKRSVKALNEVGMAMILRIRKEMMKRRVGIRVYRFTLARPTLLFVRCFVPWLYKDKQYLDHEVMDYSPNKIK